MPLPSGRLHIFALLCIVCILFLHFFFFSFIFVFYLFIVVVALLFLFLFAEMTGDLMSVSSCRSLNEFQCLAFFFFFFFLMAVLPFVHCSSNNSIKSTLVRVCVCARGSSGEGGRQLASTLRSIRAQSI